MTFVVVLAISSAVFFYIQAWKYAMGPRRWGFMDFLMGPFLYPMFRTHKRMKILKAAGVKSIYFCA